VQVLRKDGPTSANRKPGFANWLAASAAGSASLPEP
jgi:hypothetical protein